MCVSRICQYAEKYCGQIPGKWRDEWGNSYTYPPAGKSLSYASKKNRAALRAFVFRTDNFMCCSCCLFADPCFDEKSFDGFESVWAYKDGKKVFFQLDHLIPRRLGGCSSPHNLRVLCAPCNAKKGGKYIGWQI
jgi:hypothetical protein